MKKLTLNLFLVLTALSSFSQWNLVWSDEFNYTGEPDVNKWSYDPGPNPYNNEMQYYSTNLENTRVENGNLVMEVKQEAMGEKNYTSSRINTKTKASWTYGKMEARMKLTEGEKLWPAFWMMPVTNTYGTWPASGEIDIMEYWSWDDAATFGNYHCANYFAKYGLRKAITNPSTDWHLFGVEWSESKIIFSVDNEAYATYNNPGTGSNDWPFNKPFYIIFNIAVEEGATGKDSTWTKTTVEVDYVRVYTAGPVVPVIGIGLNTNETEVTKYGTTQLVASIEPANASNKDIIWTSSNEAIAKVNTSGVVTGIANGTATITATTSDGNKTASCTVTVAGTAPCSLLTIFNVPLSQPLPVIDKSFTNIHVLGSDGPDLSNLTSFQVAWDANNSALYNFAFNTSNGNPGWWFDLNAKTMQTFDSPNPSCTISGSGINGLDGEYYVNVDNNNFVMVEKNSLYAIYLSNSSIAPDGCSQSTIDTEAPTTPANITSIPSSNSVQLNWNASSDNIGVAAYNIYESSVLIATINSTNYTVNSLSASTQYSFSIQAIDAAGNLSQKANITVTTNEEVDLIKPTTPSNLTAEVSTNSIILNWSASSDNVGVSGYNIYNGSALITSTLQTNTNVHNLDPGTMYTFYIEAFDEAGNTSLKASNTFTTKTNTVNFPLKIEAEDYSSMLGIKTQACSEGTENVGWTNAGDYLKYTLTIPTEGDYLLSYRVASLNGGGKLNLKADYSNDILAELTIPNTGGWQVWTTQSHTAHLAAGTYSITLEVIIGGFNLNYFTIEPENTTPVNPLFIEAEDYVDYFGIETENCSEGTLNIGWVDMGDWMAYNIDIPEEGLYNIDLRVASSVNGGKISIENFGGSPIYNTIDVPNTNGWQNWTTITTQVDLNAGNQTIALTAAQGGWNLNWLQLSKNTAKNATLSIENDRAKIKCYPTIASSTITIDNINNYDALKLHLFSSIGTLIKTAYLENAYTKTLNIEHLETGVYFIKLESDLPLQTFKFIKQ
ncbi:MAG: carbohydrate-binding protein [Salinivirgaceae bacterium]|jgi:beta-glucanase (GH16 family)|nr:carbohydrate-binding protein [Salinivirgaceae bacterium]